VEKPAGDEPMADQQVCRLPWFLVTSGLDDDTAAASRNERAGEIGRLATVA
jgi:hypothetical protein